MVSIGKAPLADRERLGPAALHQAGDARHRSQAAEVTRRLIHHKGAMTGFVILFVLSSGGVTGTDHRNARSN